MSFSALLVGEDALSGGKDKMTELSGGQNVTGPLFEFREDNIVAGGDDTAFVDSSDEFNDDFLASVIVDNFELSDVVVLLHDAEELDENLGDGSEQNLLLSFSLGVHNCLEGISQDVDFHHSPTIKIIIFIFELMPSLLGTNFCPHLLFLSLFLMAIKSTEFHAV